MFALDGQIEMDENMYFFNQGFENLFRTVPTVIHSVDYATYLQNYPPALMIKNMESGGDIYEQSRRLQAHSKIVEAIDHSTHIGKNRHIQGPSLFAGRNTTSHKRPQVQVQVPAGYLKRKAGGAYEKGSAAINNLLVQMQGAHA